MTDGFCSLQKKKHQNFGESDHTSSVDYQFANLNLNQSYKCSEINQIQSKTSLNDSTKTFKDTINLHHQSSKVTNKSGTKPLNNSFLQTSAYSTFCEKDNEKYWKKDGKSLNNNSTLSLHITAYENSIGALNSEEKIKKENSKNKISNKAQNNIKQYFVSASSSLISAFEIPRQKEVISNIPEVMQFKASQKMFDPMNNAIKIQITDKGLRVSFNGEYGIFFHRDTGKFYYTNSLNESTWTRPDGVSISDERLVLIRNFIEYQMENGDDNKIAVRCFEYLQALNPKSYLGEFFAGMDDDQKQALISRCCVEYFILLLDEKMLEKDENKRLKPSMSWEAVSKLLNSDKRFYLVTRPSEKKSIFNKWKETAPEREKRTKELQLEAYCKMFTENMSAHKSFNSNFDYSAASEVFSNEKFWTSVPSDDRRVVFEEVMKRIQKRIEKEEENYRKENIQSLANILKDMQSINCETTWAQAQRLLAQNHNFQGNSSLMNMDKEDALCVFTTHIRCLIEEYRQMRDRSKITQFRKERKTREKFQELLVELRRRDIITLKTKWKEISPLICKEDRFMDLLTQTGPTPVDFFKFFMIDWNAEFKNNLDFVLEIMEKENFNFNLSTTYEAFIAFVEPNSKPSQVNRENYQYIYDSLLRDLIERTSKQENAAEKLRQTFIAQLKKLESNPEVNIRDVEAVSRYFKARWHISENVEAILLKLREEYLGQEEGELAPDNKRYTDSSRSSSPYTPKKKSKKEKKNRKRHHSSDREYNKKKKHRRHRSPSVEDDRRYHESSPNHRNHKSSRKY